MFIREGTPKGLRTISTGVPSGRKGISSSGRMRATTPLLPWRPGHLVALGDLPLLGHVDPDQLVDARGSSSSFSREKTFTSTTTPPSPWGTRREVSRTSRAFSPKMARSRRSSAVSSVSPLGVTLPTRMSPGRTSAPMRTMPRSSRSFSCVFAHVGDVPGDLLGPQLGIPGLALVLLDVDGGEDVFLHQLLADEDGVLEVVAFPGHERHQDVLAPGPARPDRWRARRRCTSPASTRSPLRTMGCWLMHVPWLDRSNFMSR